MIEIIVHAWAERFPQYATLLRYQIDSLVRFPPRVPVIVTVCFTPSDLLVRKAMNEGHEKFAKIREQPLTLGQLGRRSIGRDLAAKHTKADLVWFADADYYFGPLCLDTLYDVWRKREHTTLPVGPPNPAWVGYFPRFVRGSIEHEQGEAAIARAANADVVPPLDPAEYRRQMQLRPIGGTQIASGAYCRERGYCRGSRKWQAERAEDRCFTDTRDDVKFRKQMEKDKIPIQAVQLPNLYRIRHAASPVGRIQPGDSQAVP